MRADLAIIPWISLRFIRATSPDTRHRPVLRPAQGLPVFLLRFPRRGVRNDWAESRARGARMLLTCGASRLPFGTAGGGSAHRRRTMRRTGPRKQVFACVPHATVLSACNSQRRHALGALTECLASPHCWVLGPPTPSAGRRPFTTLRRAPPARPARKAHRRDGSVASRSAPATRPARLLTGAGRRQSISETAKLSIYEKQKFDHEGVSVVGMRRPLLSLPGLSRQPRLGEALRSVRLLSGMAGSSPAMTTAVIASKAQHQRTQKR